MALVRVEQRTISDKNEIAEYLFQIGIGYEFWPPKEQITEDATDYEILAAYKQEIDSLKQRGGYITADIINITPNTDNLEAMLAKFNREHWHDEDEVRYVIKGSGLFHINPQTSPVVSIQVGAGDLIQLPRAVKHWFTLCPDREIQAVRLFQNPSGWTPFYTQSQIDERFEPLCFGLSHIPSKVLKDASDKIDSSRY